MTRCWLLTGLMTCVLGISAWSEVTAQPLAHPPAPLSGGNITVTPRQSPAAPSNSLELVPGNDTVPDLSIRAPGSSSGSTNPGSGSTIIIDRRRPGGKTPAELREIQRLKDEQTLKEQQGFVNADTPHKKRKEEDVDDHLIPFKYKKYHAQGIYRPWTHVPDQKYWYGPKYHAWIPGSRTIYDPKWTNPYYVESDPTKTPVGTNYPTSLPPGFTPSTNGEPISPGTTQPTPVKGAAMSKPAITTAQAPSYRAPGYSIPSSSAPNYSAPSSSTPSSSVPAASAPNYHAPNYSGPSYGTPTYTAPQGYAGNGAAPGQVVSPTGAAPYANGPVMEGAPGYSPYAPFWTPGVAYTHHPGGYNHDLGFDDVNYRPRHAGSYSPYVGYYGYGGRFHYGYGPYNYKWAGGYSGFGTNGHFNYWLPQSGLQY